MGGCYLLAVGGLGLPSSCAGTASVALGAPSLLLALAPLLCTTLALPYTLTLGLAVGTVFRLTFGLGLGRVPVLGKVEV